MSSPYKNPRWEKWGIFITGLSIAQPEAKVYCEKGLSGL